MTMLMVLDMISPDILKEQRDFDWHGTAPPVGPDEPHLLFTAPTNESPIGRKLRMLREVKRACMACTMCELGRKGASKDGKLFRDPHVFSNLNPTRFMVVGQGPGWNELEKCEPFVGQSGENFDNEIRKNGLCRGDFYICNTVRCFVDGNAKPSEKQARLCEPFLRIEINLIHPLLVVALGAVAFERLCPGVVFNDGLGTVTTSKIYNVPVFAVYHPSPLNLQDLARRQLFADQMRILCKLVKRLKEKSQSSELNGSN